MLFGIRPIQNLLATENVKHVLDIGAGKGYLSLFAASYGAQIDAVEPTKRKRRRFPPFLKRHPNITHHELPIQEFSIDKPYDLVICKNVIMFLKRTYVLEQLLPELLEKISS